MPELPSIVRRAKNFAVAAVTHAADGFRKISEEQRAERLAICQTCESYHKDGICMEAECGCWLSRKSAWRTAKCPIGKWDAITD